MILALAKSAWGFLRGIQWQVWLVAAVVAAGWWYGEQRFDAGVAGERAKWEAEQAKADRDAAKEAQRQADASTDATQAKDDRLNERLPAIEGRTHEATERIRIIYRDRPVPVDCARPAGVRDEIRAAVERANAAAGQLRGRPGGIDSPAAGRSGTGG